MIRYFISDLHLSDERPDLIRAFGVLMNHLVEQKKASQHAELYIVGDFYERWIGDDDRSVWKDEVESSLFKLIQSDIKVIFFHGNRDFLLDASWAKRMGVQLVEDSLVIEEKGCKILLSHGDEACLDDIEYQKFRIMVRNKQWKHNFLAQPLAKRIEVTEQLREKSKAVKLEKSLDIMDVSTSEIDKLMQQHNSQLMIHGHTHRPNLHETTYGHRIVLGDWHSHAWLGVLGQGYFKQLKIELSDLQPKLSKSSELSKRILQSSAFHELDLT